ncbi:hypothetical protein [Candidatus Ichthyocystis sparus]|uniref:hypothetical protein n=2 Tax=Burkholderiales genera incertae sedis TaxID=224471 RepID=UPI000B8769B7|nr:hypothetical protein [Candidatus Ichthyocystis sparus]
MFFVLLGGMIFSRLGLSLPVLLPVLGFFCWPRVDIFSFPVGYFQSCPHPVLMMDLGGEDCVHE